MSARTKFFAFTGGENLVDPVIMMDAGELHDSLNYENRTNGGYRRIQGYERYDGQPSPSQFPLSNYNSRDDWIVAVEAARANILPLPGSGPVRGVWVYNGITYGWRDNAAGTACVMYKATVTGWQEVPMNYTLNFTAGTSEILIGDTITGDSSGATAVVCRIFVESGDWSTNDAAGRLYFKPADLTGSFTAAENIKVATVPSAINTAPEELLTFPAGGRYECVNYNFYGHSGTIAMYGVNGVGNAFFYDEDDVVFIKTGMTYDTPQHVFCFKKHLFLSFSGGSIQHSSIGEPFEWNAITGASEIAIGDKCVGFESAAGDALAIFGRNNLSLLYGTSVADWNLVTYSQESGAIEWSMQRMGVPFYLDDLGIKTISTSMDYGDFNTNTLSQKIKPKLDKLTNMLNCSLKVKGKDQYRLFYNDGTILYMALDSGKVKGITHCNYGYYDQNEVFYDKIMEVAVSSEDVNGAEVLFAGDGDGYVYKLDHGNSFDGQEVAAYIRPVFHHFGSPENFKRFIKVVLEIEAEETLKMTFLPEFSYASSEFPPAIESTIQVIAGAGVWGTSYWETFYWDTQSLSTAFAYLTGIGKNFRMIIKSFSTYETPHTIQGVTIHYTLKGLAK